MKGRKLITRIVAIIMTAFMIVSSSNFNYPVFGFLGKKNVKTVEAADSDTMKDTMDPTMYEVVKILYNYQTDKINNPDKKSFYTVLEEKGLDPYTTDIRTLTEANDYKDKDVTFGQFRSLAGSINLYPYNDISSLTDLSYGKAIQEVVLPGSFTTIPKESFKEMINLVSVTMSPSVTTIGDNAFDSCTKLKTLKTSSDGEDDIIDLSQVTEVGAFAFSGCREIVSVKFYVTGVDEVEDGVNFNSKKINIGASAFRACEKLQIVKIPFGNLGSGVFQYCTGITDVYMNDSYTMVPDTCFQQAGSMMTIHLPKNLERIGHYSFDESKIASINLCPKNAEDEDYCAKLKYIYDYAFKKSIFGNNNSFDFRRTQLEEIRQSAFYGAHFGSLLDEGFVIRDSLKYMGITVFAYTSGLTKVHFPASLWKIPDGSFYCSFNLKTVTIQSDALNQVGKYSFAYCCSLNNIDFLGHTYAKNLELIDDYAFKSCVPMSKAQIGSPEYGLRNIRVSDDVTTLGTGVFINNFTVTEAYFGANVKVIPDYTLYVDCNDDEIDIDGVTIQPNDVHTDDWMGEYKESYQSIDENDPFRYIDDINKTICMQYEDDARIGLDTLQLSDDLTSINAYAFHGQCKLRIICKTSEEVPAVDEFDDYVSHFGENLNSIGDYAFKYCSYGFDKNNDSDNPSYKYYGLKHVILPDNVSELGKETFYKDYSLESIQLPEEGLSIIPTKCFAECGIIEKKSVNAKYKDGNLVENPYPGKYHGLTDINLGAMEDLLYIEDNAFYQDYCLDFSLPEKLRSIGSSAFYKVYNTPSLDFGADLIRIGNSAFSYTGILDKDENGDEIFMAENYFPADGLTSSVNGLTSVDFTYAIHLGDEEYKTSSEKYDAGIADSAFSYSPIQNLDTLSNTSITKVSRSAFACCYDLAYAFCPKTVKSIERYAFTNCYNLKNLTFPVDSLLDEEMINGKCQKVVLLPNLGEYDGMIFDVPVGQQIGLPSKAFKNKINIKISQRIYDQDSRPQSDLQEEDKIFTIIDGEKNILDIIGKDSEYVGSEGNPGAYAIVAADVEFKDINRNMSMTYPINIREVPAKAISFKEDMFKTSKGTPGHIVKSSIERVPDTLYINNVLNGSKLTLVAAIAPLLPEDSEGHITQPVHWTEETEALKIVGEPYLVDEKGNKITDINNDEVIDHKDYRGRILYSAAEYNITDVKTGQEIEVWVGDKKESALLNKLAVSICDPIKDITYSMKSDVDGKTFANNISRFEMPQAVDPTIGNGQKQTIKYEIKFDEDVSDRSDNIVVYVNNNLTTDKEEIINIVSNDPVKGELVIEALRPGTARVYIESATKSKSKNFDVRVKSLSDGVTPAVIDIVSDEYIDGNGDGYVYKGQTSGFDVEILPSYATKDVNWSLSNNKGIMTLTTDENGSAIINGVDLGNDYLNARTTVESGSTSDRIKVNVLEMSEGIKFLQDELNVEVGKNKYIDIVSSADKKEGLLRLPETSKDIVTFTVEDPGILEVSASSSGDYSGSVSSAERIYYKGIKDGSTIIKATTKNGFSSEIIINVVGSPISDVSFDVDDVTLYEGESRAIVPKITPVDSSEKIVYSSGDTDIATVDPITGKVTAVSAGKTRITAKGALSGRNDYYSVIVTKKASSIKFIKDSTAIYKDDVKKITFEWDPDEDEGLLITPSESKEEITFKVKDPTVVVVSPTDKEGTYERTCVSTSKFYIMGLKTGETTIEAKTSSGQVAIYTVRVVGTKIEALEFAKESYSVMAGSTVSTKVKLTPSTADEMVEYISDDPSIAKVDANGVITGVKVGETEITVKSVPGGKKAYCKVVVTKKINPGDPGSTAVSGDAKIKVNSDGKSATYEGSVSASGAVNIPATVSVGGKTLPVTAIKAGAFKNNTKITKLVIGANVKTIGASAFEGCTKLKSVTIGANVTTIGNNAFKNCKSLTKIVIPKKVTSIGKQAFAGCSKLKLVTFKTTKLKKIGSKAFKTIKKGAKFKCPKKKLKDYKKLLKKSGLPKKAKVTK